MIVLYAWADEGHYNYVHLSSDSAEKQIVHNGVFHVYGGDRVRISKAVGPGTLPTEQWIKVKIVHDGRTGRVYADVDGKRNASLDAVDVSLTEGRVGLGSFFETGAFRNVRIMGGVITRRNLLWAGAPAILRGAVPAAEQGAMAGDVVPGRAMIWSRTDRPARMQVRWSAREDLANARTQPGPLCTAATDFTGRLEISGLGPGQRVYYEVTFADANAKNSVSQPVRGSFRTPPASARRDCETAVGRRCVRTGLGH